MPDDAVSQCDKESENGVASSDGSIQVLQAKPRDLNC
jgi:hypothetical protein